MAAPGAESWQHKKQEEPKQTHGYARDRRIDENRISKSRGNLATLDRPPHSCHIDDAVEDADEEKKQSGGNRTEVRNGSSIHRLSSN